MAASCEFFHRQFKEIWFPDGQLLTLMNATVRDETQLNKIDSPSEACSDKFFDTTQLQKALAKQCPQLKIRKCGSTNGIDKVMHAPWRFYMEPSHTKGTFRALIGNVLEGSGLNLTDVTPSNPVLVNAGDSYVVRYSRQSRVRAGLFH